jgi:hypothetical protein
MVVFLSLLRPSDRAYSSCPSRNEMTVKRAYSMYSNFKMAFIMASNNRCVLKRIVSTISYATLFLELLSCALGDSTVDVVELSQVVVGMLSQYCSGCMNNHSTIG